MTTSTHSAGAEHDTADRRTHLDADVRLLTFTGVSAVVSILGLAGFLALSSRTGADPLSSSLAQLDHALAARSGAGIAGPTLAVSALSYLPLIAFLAGVRTLLARIDASGIAASVVGIAAPMFLAGVVASDGFNLALAIAQHSVATFHGDPGVARMFAAGWRISLVEAQIGLATVCGATGIACLRAHPRATRIRMPRWVGVWGLLGAAAVVPMVTDPSALPVFVGSNLMRFSWILVMGVSSLLLARRLRRGAV